MVLFLRNKRFNFMLFWGDYFLRWWRLPIEERACRKQIWVAVITIWGTLDSLPHETHQIALNVFSSFLRFMLPILNWIIFFQIKLTRVIILNEKFINKKNYNLNLRYILFSVNNNVFPISRAELVVVTAKLKASIVEAEEWRGQALEAREEIESLKLHIDALQSEKVFSSMIKYFSSSLWF